MAVRSSASFGIPSGYTLVAQQDIPRSDSVRCYYGDPHTATRPRYEYTCGKTGGCCDAGCCPTDSVWIGGIIVLVVFVVIVAIVAIIVVIVCFQRSKKQEKKELMEHSYTASVGPPTYYNTGQGLSPYPAPPPSIYNTGPVYNPGAMPYNYGYPPPSEHRYNMFENASMRRY